MKTPIILGLCILFLPLVSAISYNSYGDDKLIFNQTDFLVNGTIDDLSLIQVYDLRSSLLIDIQLLKLNENKTKELKENDNLTVIISENTDNIKFGYTANLFGRKGKSCSDDPDCPADKICSGGFCIKEDKPPINNLGFQLRITSNREISKADDHLFKLSSFYFDYNDLLEEDFDVIETEDGTLLILDISKDWERYNISYNDLITIDPYIGSSTPSSPKATSGGSGRGYAVKMAPNAIPTPPEEKERSWLDCKEWEYWDNDRCVVKPAPPEKKFPWWILIIFIIIIYRDKIKMWLK